MRRGGGEEGGPWYLHSQAVLAHYEGSKGYQAGLFKLLVIIKSWRKPAQSKTERHHGLPELSI